jgi:hypothetical protein
LSTDMDKYIGIQQVADMSATLLSDLPIQGITVAVILSVMMYITQQTGAWFSWSKSEH